MRVGIVGVGPMGQAFAENLIKAGFSVQGYDVDPKRVEEFKERGGEAVDSPAAVAREVRWVITSLPKSNVVRDVTLGPGSIAEGAEPGLIVVDTSTSLPQESRSLGADLAARGIRFLDASVSGTGATALEKDVVVLAGGEKADFESCRPLFEGFSRKAYHLGPLGSGAQAKLAINVAVVGNRLALAEALIFGIKAGMEPEALLAVLKDGSSYSRAMDLKGKKMIQGDFTPESRLGASVDGCALLLEQGRQLGAPLFLTSVYAQIAQAGVHMGFGDADPASLIEVLRMMAGLARRG